VPELGCAPFVALRTPDLADARHRAYVAGVKTRMGRRFSIAIGSDLGATRAAQRR
jgi:hypothetical protein